VGGDASLILDVGLGYIVSRNVQADLSLGTAARGLGPSSFVSFGLIGAASPIKRAPVAARFA
jgi:hypothetical protein